MDRDWTSIDNRMNDAEWFSRNEYHSVFKILRDEDPVHYVKNEAFGKNYWAITRYDDVKAVYANHQQFSNRWSNRMPRTPGRVTPEERTAAGLDLRVANLDMPYHAMYRRPMNKHWSTPAIARLADDIDGYVDEIIGEVAEKSEFDLVTDVAAQLPIRVILGMMGVPREDWPMLIRAVNAHGAPSDPRYIVDGDPAKTAHEALMLVADYSTDLALERRKNPKDDFATVIGQLKVDGDDLSLAEMRSWFIVIILGGLESTRNGLGVGLWQLLEHPDQRKSVLENPDLINGALDEILRWSSPSRDNMRIAVEDLDFHGKRIRAHDWVIVYPASANRDERVFSEPDRFDITRTPNEHLAIGEGVHKCLGRALLRLEISTAIRKVLTAFPELEILTEPTWIKDVSNSGLDSLRVRHNGLVVV